MQTPKAYLFYAIEYIGLYFYKLLNKKNQKGISNHNYLTQNG